MFVRVSQDPHLCHAHAYHDHYQYVDHDLGTFEQDQHGGEYDADDQDYDNVGEDGGKAHNDDMFEGEDEEDHHQLNAPHLGDSLPDVRVNHNFFQDLQAPCLTLSICAAYLFVFI